jgi:vacuolar-type H+-ATPase subunit I/STV1
MSIARMTKVSVLAPRDMREGMLDQLHRMGTVHIIDVSSAAAVDEDLKPFHTPFVPETRTLRLTLAQTDFVIELLDRFEGKKKGLISSFLTQKTHLTYEEFMAIEGEIDLERLYRELEELDVGFRRAESVISELEDELEAMVPWSRLDCPLSAMNARNGGLGRGVPRERQGLPGGTGPRG